VPSRDVYLCTVYSIIILNSFLYNCSGSGLAVLTQKFSCAVTKGQQAQLMGWRGEPSSDSF